MIRHEDCWAKTAVDRPGISVEQHCLTTGVIARLLVQRKPGRLTEALLARHGVALAAIHDVGKVAIGFQCKCPTWRQAHCVTPIQFAGAETDHGKIGQRAIQEELEEKGLPYLWAAAVGAHHGRIKGARLSTLCDGEPSLREERRRFIAEMMAEFGPLPDTDVDGRSVALWFNAGLIAVADWLASDECRFPPDKRLDPPEIVERAKTHLEEVGFAPLQISAERPTFQDLFPQLTNGPNSLQRAMMEAARKPGVYVVEASMGTGKTEAALMATANLVTDGEASGLYFALPTQTTSNRIHERVGDYIKRLAPGGRTRLIHGNSWLSDRTAPVTGDQWTDDAKDGPQHVGRDWFASSRRALLAPFGVGTVDQALLGVVAAKHFFVRQFGLAGKVVVLDEVHSYDLYTGTLINKLVGTLRELGATVIILSATLTAERRRQLLGAEDRTEDAESKPCPLISISAEGDQTEVSPPPEPPKTVQTSFSSISDLTEFALNRASAGQCVLWIRNTVHDAQETYCALTFPHARGDGPRLDLQSRD